jgi:hypothetical protein
MSNQILNYDTDLTCSGRMAKQSVRLTFGLWWYRAVLDVEVEGNCTGIVVINCAVDTAYSQLEQRSIRMSDQTYAVLNMPSLKDPDDILESSEDDGGDRLRGEGWLKDLLISAEIIAISAAS